MQPIRTLNYAEYIVATTIKEDFKKYSVSVPASENQKGYDLVLLDENNKALTIQVKASRIHYVQKGYPYRMFFNVFEPNKNADLFLLCGMVPDDENVKSKKFHKIILVFTYAEIVDFLNSLKLKKDSTKKETKFEFGFNNKDCIKLIRGHATESDFSQYLYESQKNKFVIKE